MANWHIKPSSAGAANGTNWTNAWSITNLNANWASVNPGDTIFLAGGSYTATIEIRAAGTAGNPITIKRATVANHGSATGWDVAFDVQVVIAPVAETALLWYYTAGDYITVDGVTTNGIKLQYDNAASVFAGAVNWGGSLSFHDIIIQYCDICGPGTGTYGSPASFAYAFDNAPILVKGSGNVYNVTISHCDVHGGVNLIQAGYIGIAYNWTVEHCRFFDNFSGSGLHANVFYLQRAHDWTVRYNDFSGWQIEGIGNFNVSGPMNFYVYGNIFHHPVPPSASCFWNSDVLAGSDGPLYLYNNTFYGVVVQNGQANDRPFASGSIARNNIYWNTLLVYAIADSDYSFSDFATTPGMANGKGGANSITTGANPFINGSASNFHITDVVGANYPKDKGVYLGPPYQVDPDGITRGTDGLWDIGAYEFAELTGPPVTISGVPVF